MTTLQKQKAYTYTTEKGEKIEHYKHLVVIPEDVVTKSGWSEGTQLEVTVTGGKIILKPQNEKA